MGNGDKRNDECCCIPNDIITCICELDQKINCIKDVFGHKQYLEPMAKEKILLCILLREIAKLDKKLDRILQELDCDWDECCCDNDRNGDSDSDDE